MPRIGSLRTRASVGTKPPPVVAGWVTKGPRGSHTPKKQHANPQRAHNGLTLSQSKGADSWLVEDHYLGDEGLDVSSVLETAT
jgi:hypothetical protein